MNRAHSHCLLPSCVCCEWQYNTWSIKFPIQDRVNQGPTWVTWILNFWAGVHSQFFHICFFYLCTQCLWCACLGLLCVETFENLMPHDLLVIHPITNYTSAQLLQDLSKWTTPVSFSTIPFHSNFFFSETNRFFFNKSSCLKAAMLWIYSLSACSQL